jgi:hypothetical protein
MKLTKFWMVWNPQGNAPRYQHGSKSSADTEALRLARQHRGQQFIVLKAVGGACSQEAPIEPIMFVAGASDDIPF